MNRLLYISIGALAVLTSCRSHKTTADASAPTNSADYVSLGQQARDTLVLMSYNVENFFDPEDDPNKFDDDFTPNGVYHWTLARMKAKARRLARVICTANGQIRPDIVGLCEVEGLPATKVLANETGLDGKYLAYKPICYPTLDGRGIAVAMLYDESRVDLLGAHPIFVSKPDSGLKTRDVLYARFKLRTTNDTLHVMMNHWPSKYSGAQASIWKRNHVASRVRTVCDSILGTNKNAKIILMGDFNDTADADALTQILGAQVKNNSCTYRNLSADTHDSSYRYKGQWGSIDHIIVTPGVCRLGRPKYSIVKLPYLLEDDDLYPGLKPKRTYIGRRFNYSADNLGGYSDHLPVLLKVAL